MKSLSLVPAFEDGRQGCTSEVTIDEMFGVNSSAPSEGLANMCFSICIQSVDVLAAVFIALSYSRVRDVPISSLTTTWIHRPCQARFLMRINKHQQLIVHRRKDSLVAALLRLRED